MHLGYRWAGEVRIETNFSRYVAAALAIVNNTYQAFSVAQAGVGGVFPFCISSVVTSPPGKIYATFASLLSSANLYPITK